MGRVPRQILGLLATAAAAVATMGTSPLRAEMSPPWTEVAVIADGDQARFLDGSTSRVVWQVGVTVSSPASIVEVTGATVRLNGFAFTTSVFGQVVLTVHELQRSEDGEAPDWELVEEQLLPVGQDDAPVLFDPVGLSWVPDCGPVGPSLCSLEYRFSLENSAGGPVTIEPQLELSIEGVRTAPTVTFDVEELQFASIAAAP